MGLTGNGRQTARFMLRLSAAAVLLAACGERERPSQGEASMQSWTQIEWVGHYRFLGEVLEDEDLSSLAFISDRHGLVGADEACAVQALELSREARTLRVLRTIPLLDSGDEIDIEGIAAEPQGYYIVGSHGLSKKQGEDQENRFRIFRLRVDPATGLPAQRSVPQMASLNDVLGADPTLGEYLRQPLQHKGVNIEGLAVRDGRLFVGFRSPNLDGDAFVMEIHATDVFEQRPRPQYKLHRLALGPGLGIREIVAAREGFLIIAGNAGAEPSATFRQSQDYEEDRGFFLYRWDGRQTEVHEIGRLPDAPGKAEAMTILEETTDHATVLILFDGLTRGRPSVYRIS